MIVAFDGAPLGDGPPLGVALSFLCGLRAYAAATTNTTILLLPAGAPDPTIQGIRVVAAPRGALRRQLALTGLLRALMVDVLHSPVAAVPLLTGRPRVATAHDLPWLEPTSGETTRWRQRLPVTMSLRRAAAVLVPSQFTASAVAKVLGDRRRLHVVPHAVEPPTGPPVDPRDRQGPLLVLGDDRPRKNRIRIAAAHALAQRRRPDLPPLCFAGPPHNYVDEPGKLRLLRGCRALLHCSLYEGFGLPVLEGLAHGIPVLCSDLPSHREIAGDAALYVDPRDPGAIAAGILRVVDDADLRARLAAVGPPRAAAFRPEHIAAAWHRIHAEIAR